MIVLLDLDDVLADWDGGFRKQWQKAYPELELDAERTTFYIGQEDTPEQQERIYSLTHEQGFFESLEPIPGALEAYQDIRALGHDVFIVTSPGTTFDYAAGEKYRWVKGHLGQDALTSLVMTPSKHIINGDILIDDRPNIKSEQLASWEHVLYDTSYNAKVQGKRRINWNNWREVLTELL